MFDNVEERVKVPGSGVFMPRTSGVLAVRNVLGLVVS
jgi:hypothetical protein